MMTTEDLEIWMGDIHTIASRVGGTPSEVAALIVGGCHLKGYDVVAEAISEVAEAQEHTAKAVEEIARIMRFEAELD